VSFGPKQNYLYAGDRLALQLDWSEDESPVRRYIAVDHLNSTRVVVTDDDGVVTAEEVDYLPFGGFLTGDPQPDTTHLFTGHERDTAQLASNLDYMHARYFSPNLGRFLSVDLAGGRVGSSQSWNRYSYLTNSPITFLDPTGLELEAFEFQGQRVLVDSRIAGNVRAFLTQASEVGVPIRINYSFRTTADLHRGRSQTRVHRQPNLISQHRQLQLNLQRCRRRRLARPASSALSKAVL
jgi:RHS repeat-associated protein